MARYGIGDSDGDGRHALGWYKKEKEEGKVYGSYMQRIEGVVQLNPPMPTPRRTPVSGPGPVPRHKRVTSSVRVGGLSK